MITRGKCTVVGVVLGLVLALGAGSAWAQPRGIVPLHKSGAAALRAGTGTGVVGAAVAGPSTGVPCGSYSPCNPPLLYGGGPVMHGVTTHVIAWAPSSATPFPSGYVGGFEQYLSDLASGLSETTSVSSVAAQYVDASGSALSSLSNATPIADQPTDTNPYPASGCNPVTPATVCLSEQQIITEVENQIGSTLPVDLGQSYIVLLPPNVDSCDNSGTQCADNYFCGYHDSIYTGSAQTTFTLLPYTGESYPSSVGYSCDGPSGPNGMPADLTALDSVGAHELLESATDPLGTGYLDATGNEIADECAWTFDPYSTSGSGYANQTVNGNQYLIQDMWSNQDASCVEGDPNPATATVTVTSGGIPEIDSPISFGVTLSGATAASYRWSYADQFGDVNGGAGSGADPQITFPSAGTYTVWVEVTDATGGTVTGVTQITVAAPPRSSFTWSPASPAARTGVTFYQAASAGSGSITGYSWSFGDGGSSTAANPSYSYASAGTYTVTLTVTQSDGLTASSQQSITVAAPVATPPAAPPAPSRATIITSVRRSLVPVRGTTTVKLLRTGTAMSVPFKPSVSGEISITWYAVARHHKIVVARGTDAATAGVLARVEVRLTAAGRRLLRRSRSLKVTAMGVYRYGTGTISLTRKFTLRH